MSDDWYPAGKTWGLTRLLLGVGAVSGIIAVGGLAVGAFSKAAQGVSILGGSSQAANIFSVIAGHSFNIGLGGTVIAIPTLLVGGVLFMGFVGMLMTLRGNRP